MITEEQANEIAKAYYKILGKYDIEFGQFVSLQLSILRDSMCATYITKEKQLDIWKYIQRTMQRITHEIKRGDYVEEAKERKN
jgi:predicted nucleic acid-binding protein